jgi:8-oxo-dGTP pyrophosphatase MutT (NUDIX family)
MRLKLFELLRSPGGERAPGTTSPRGQVGAIPFTHVDGQIVFLMITSRRTGLWIFPKGGRIEGLSDAESAAQEAFEEAGVRGRIAATPVGTYRTLRVRPEGDAMVDIVMYPLAVTEQLDTWPERSARRRHWVVLAEACRLLSDPELVVLAERVAQGALAGDKP